MVGPPSPRPSIRHLSTGERIRVRGCAAMFYAGSRGTPQHSLRERHTTPTPRPPSPEGMGEEKRNPPPSPPKGGLAALRAVPRCAWGGLRPSAASVHVRGCDLCCHTPTP